MTYIASILDGLIAVIDGWTVGVLSATAADIEAKFGKDARGLS
jgi:hypothetical protein